MNINFKDGDDTNVNIDSSGVAIIMDRVKAAGAVAMDTVLSIESHLNGQVIPNNIKNKISTQPSTHGLSELIRYIDSRTTVTTNTTESMVVGTLYTKLRNIKKRRLSTILTKLHNYKISINKVYVSDSYSHLTKGANTLTEVPVNLLLPGSVLGKLYNSSVNTEGLIDLTNIVTPVSYGCIEILINYADGFFISDNILNGTYLVYPGTLGEYIDLTIEAITKLDTINLMDLESELANDIDRYNRLSSNFNCEDAVRVICDNDNICNNL